MSKLYILFDESGKVTGSNYFEDAPVNATDILPQQNFVEMYFDRANGVFYDGATAEQIRSKNIENTKGKYELHKANGWNAYQDFRANIVEQISDGLLTEEQAFMIEINLSVGYDKIQQTGDWKTALYLLQNTTVSDAFIEPYRIAAIEIIEGYISNNYES